MNSNIESWVSEVASQLDLPTKQEAAVISELRTHLQADFSDRLRRGLSEAEATRETLAEMGESESVAGELNHIHRPEGSLARSFLAVLIMLAGNSGVLLMRGAAQTYTRLADESGRRAWYDLFRLVTNNAIVERLFFLVPLAGVAFIVGYIARKRAWRCALLPVFAFPVLMILMMLTLALILGDLDEILPYMHWSPSLAGTANFAIEVLAILVGAHLGAQLARSTSPYRRSLFALFAGMAGIIPAVGLILIVISSVYSAAGRFSGLLFLAPILILMVWGLVLLARRVYRMHA
jgi:hypothetical protein